MLETPSQNFPPASRVPSNPDEFWQQILTDANSIRYRLLARARQSESPFERKRLERLALCAAAMASILHPGGGGHRR